PTATFICSSPNPAMAAPRPPSVTADWTMAARYGVLHRPGFRRMAPQRTDRLAGVSRHRARENRRRPGREHMANPHERAYPRCGTGPDGRIYVLTDRSDGNVGASGPRRIRLPRRRFMFVGFACGEGY